MYAEYTLDKCVAIPKVLKDHAVECIASKVSIYLHGTWGSGKTTFAFSLLNDMMKGSSFGFWPRFTSARELDNALLKAVKSEEGDSYELSKWIECDLLFIDDIDKVKPTERFKHQVFEIINQRYVAKKLTVITSNKEPRELSEVFDGSVVSRICDKNVWKIISLPKKDLRIC